MLIDLIKPKHDASRLRAHQDNRKAVSAAAQLHHCAEVHAVLQQNCTAACLKMKMVALPADSIPVASRLQAMQEDERAVSTAAQLDHCTAVHAVLSQNCTAAYFKMHTIALPADRVPLVSRLHATQQDKIAVNTAAPLSHAAAVCAVLRQNCTATCFQMHIVFLQADTEPLASRHL